MTLEEISQWWGGERGERPWGYYLVLLDADRFKVKVLVVNPGKRHSLQRHRRRSEHWHVVQGEALITRDAERIPLSAGGSVDIPLGAKHRIENTGMVPAVLVEVQTGEYFGEDDIERFEDDFGRV
ncbi:MAG: cupin domain-containing protein [Deltaproteobacteria bacterium]